MFRNPERRIGELMNRDVKSVSVDHDQEKIAQLFEHYHYLALPVLEKDGRLVGIVSAREVMGVLQHEATEDMQLMVGLSGEERSFTPWQTSIRKRLPWLCVNLLTAFVAGGVVQIFESTIARWTALAVFLPIVAGQGGNAGAQTLTVIVREMALGEMSRNDGRKALVKEAILGLCNGLAIGLLVGVVGYFWKGSAKLGVIVGIARRICSLYAARLQNRPGARFEHFRHDGDRRRRLLFLSRIGGACAPVLSDLIGFSSKPSSRRQFCPARRSRVAAACILCSNCPDLGGS